MQSRPRLTIILHADVVDSTKLSQIDEGAAHERIQVAFQHLKQMVEAANGQVHELRGDALVAEFSRTTDALHAAIDFQIDNMALNERLPDAVRPALRIGICLGEIIASGGTLSGTGVVLAQRIEQLAGPNGICVTSAVREVVPSRLVIDFEFLGEQTLKGFNDPVRVFRVILPDGTAKTEERQQIHFCTARDGVRLAYAITGQGPPLIKSGNWLTHLEFDWQSPVWRRMVEQLTRHYQLIRYDARGNGLSDWNVKNISIEAFVDDLETVINETGLDRFALLGLSQGCAISIAYAVRHPEKVSHLILYGGFVRGWQYSGPKTKEKWQALMALIRQGWGQRNPAYRQMFTSMIMPGASPEEMHWFNELQRISTTPDNVLKIVQALGAFDVRGLLAKIQAPTLVMHAREDAVIPFNAGLEIAEGIPNATFVPLEGQNHIFLENDPSYHRFITEVIAFLGG